MRYETGLETFGNRVRRLIEGRGPVKPGDEAGRAYAGRVYTGNGFGEKTNVAEIQEHGIGFGGDQTANLSAGVLSSGDWSQHQRVIERYDKGSAVPAQDPAEANVLPKISQRAFSGKTLQYCGNVDFGQTPVNCVERSDLLVVHCLAILATLQAGNAAEAADQRRWLRFEMLLVRADFR